MVSFTYAAITTGLLAAAANALPAAGNYDLFRAITNVTHGPKKFNNLYLTQYHIGADENFITTTRNFSDAAQFQQYGNGSTIDIPQVNESGVSYYFVNLLKSQPEHEVNGSFVPAVPKGYNIVESDITGKMTYGFNVSGNYETGKGLLTYKGALTHFSTFAICKISGESIYDGNQLLWRSNNVKPDATGQCADVALDILLELQ